jgi:beta-lactamase class D
MQANIDRLNFGNRQIGLVVDEFWLDGPLEVSAVEEAEFVAKLARQALPLSKRSQLIVRDILRVEEKNGATIFAKTGWAKRTATPIGWWTGWVERNGKIDAFSLNIDMPSDTDAPKRMSIVHAILSEMGVL